MRWTPRPLGFPRGISPWSGESLPEAAGVVLVVYKYVSDEADAEAAEGWEKNVAKGAALFARVLEEEYGKFTLQ